MTDPREAAERRREKALGAAGRRREQARVSAADVEDAVRVRAARRSERGRAAAATAAEPSEGPRDGVAGSPVERERMTEIRRARRAEQRRRVDGARGGTR